MLNKQTVQGIRLEVIRENHGEIKKYRYSYFDSGKSAERFQRSGYQCLAFPPVKLHVDYNHIKFAISGIELPEPGSDAEILLVFSGIKRRVIIWTYLFKGVVSLAGWLLIISIYAFVKRNIEGYLFLQTHFVFFDYSEPVVFYIIDYMTIMGLLIFLGYYMEKGLQSIYRKVHTR